MTDIASMEALLARIESASGPDRRLDYEIFIATAVMEAFNPWDPNKGNFFTSSLDAIVVLIARELPGWGWELCHPTDGAYGSVRIWNRDVSVTLFAKAATCPIALIAAFLRAKIAMERKE